MKRAANESQLVTAILKALKLKGVWAWRVNSSLTVLPKQGGHARRVVKGAEAGTPDILFVYERAIRTAVVSGEPVTLAAAGCLGGLEVKTVTGRQLPTQRAWQEKAERHGVRYAVVRSISEALDVVGLWSGAGKADAR